MHTAARVADIASSNVARETRALELLDELATIVPFIASHIVLARHFELGHTQLANAGYDDKTASRLASPAFQLEVERLGMMEAPAALRMKDIPDGPESIDSITECLYPAGYVEGVTATLHSSAGRYVGLLNMSTTDDRHPSDNARDLIELLSPAIAHAVDPINDLTRGFGSETRPTAMALVSGGAPAPIPVGDTPLGILENAGLAVSAANRLAGGRGRWLTQTSDGQWHRIRAFRSNEQGSPAVLVTAGDDVDLMGLTRRELEVLSLVIVGYQNPQIAEKLLITRRTVASHVEGLLRKLGLPNRAAAASVALKHGLELL